MAVDDLELLELACLAVSQIAEFIDATRGRQEFRVSREKAKIALAAVASNLLRQASERPLSVEDQQMLERFTTARFLKETRRDSRPIGASNQPLHLSNCVNEALKVRRKSHLAS